MRTASLPGWTGEQKPPVAASFPGWMRDAVVILAAPGTDAESLVFGKSHPGGPGTALDRAM